MGVRCLPRGGAVKWAVSTLLGMRATGSWPKREERRLETQRAMTIFGMGRRQVALTRSISPGLSPRPDFVVLHEVSFDALRGT